uniref:C-type lectin domain-containing protein n=1 Tax=Panagrellus redivivus TaxID=6233 RepID=A0A7E4VMN8_PANRE
MSTTLFALVGVCLLALASACLEGTVSSNDGGKCFTFVPQPLNYAEAMEVCAVFGGSLASAGNAADSVDLAGKSVAKLGPSMFWIASTDESKCKLIDGTSGKVTEADCETKMPFACVSQKSITVKDTCPAHCPSTWSYFAPTQACYKVYYNLRWDDAESTCLSESAHLASIHSQQEVDFINELATMNVSVDCGNTLPQLTWVGLYTTDNNKSWKWTDGSTVDFLQWNDGEPNEPGKENCGQVFTENCDYAYKKLNNIDCDRSVRASVCKKAALTSI